MRDVWAYSSEMYLVKQSTGMVFIIEISLERLQLRCDERLNPVLHCFMEANQAVVCIFLAMDTSLVPPLAQIERSEAILRKRSGFRFSCSHPWSSVSSLPTNRRVWLVDKNKRTLSRYRWSPHQFLNGASSLIDHRSTTLEVLKSQFLFLFRLKKVSHSNTFKQHRNALTTADTCSTNSIFSLTSF